MKVSCIIYFISILFISCFQNSKINGTIQKLDYFEKVDTIYNSEKLIMGLVKSEFYLIKNYNINDSLKIDKFVDKKRDKTWFKKYMTYSISFCRETDKTNYQNLKNNPSIFLKYSLGNDLVYFYVWSDKKFIGREVFKHEKSNITFENY